MSEWRRVRIGDFLHRVKHPVRLRDDETYKLVTVRMHHNGVVLRETKKGKLIGSNMYQVRSGQFILSGIDARHGAFGVIPDELDGAVVTNDFWYFEVDAAVVARDFFLWLTTTPLFLDACIKSSEGTTNRRRLQAEKFFNFAYRFPDIAEQHRLAERFAAFDATHLALKGEFDVQLGLLKQLRQALLQEAVEGKLTADWRRQHPMIKGDPQFDAAALLAQIKAEKEGLIKAGKIRKEKPLPAIAESDKPFELPAGWVWCRLGDLILSAKDGPHFSPVYATSGIPFISTRNISPRGIDFSTSKFITSEYHEQISKRCKPEFGDILYTKGGTTGIARVNTYETEFNVWVHVAVLKRTASMDPFYLQNALNSPHCYSQAQILTHGIGNQDLGLTRMVTITVPLPPLTEQQAIVARVDSLMAMIDELEQQVVERKGQAQLLMRAVLREAFASGEGAEGDDVCVGAQHAAPVSAIPRRTRARHAAPLRESPSVGNVGATCVRPGRMQCAPTEDLPLVAELPASYRTGEQVALLEAKQTVPGGIPARILAAMQLGRDYSRADLLDVTGISETDWVWAIRQLKEQGRVVQRGEKRGARYVRTERGGNRFEIMKTM